jgi:hypothetical protein
MIQKTVIFAKLFLLMFLVTCYRENPKINKASPDEVKRTKPDFVIHDPTGGIPREWTDPDFFWLNEQILVLVTGEGDLLATWTSERLDPHLHRIASSRSKDQGRTWSQPLYIDGAGVGSGGTAAWQVPVLSPSGRIYLFYNYSPKSGAGSFCGGFRCRTSDDGGATWSAPADLNFPRSPIDNPDTEHPSLWISISLPAFTKSGHALLGLTRWAENHDVPCGASGIKERYSHIEFMRFENISKTPDAANVQLVPLNLDNPITVPHESCPSASFAQEPYTVHLPDGRLFMTMRTNRGQAWYTVSTDEGETWSSPQPMRYKDGGASMLHPVSSCPVFALDSGEYMFLFNNNDGYVFGAESRWDVRNRRPAFVSRGQFRPEAEQPIWWSSPRLLIDNDAIPWGPDGRGRLEAAPYPSMTHGAEGNVIWYPDRKGFLVGKFFRNAWLSLLEVPQQ